MTVRILVGLSLLALGYGVGVFWSQHQAIQELTGQQSGNVPFGKQTAYESGSKIQSPVSYAVSSGTTDHLAVRSLADAASITSEFDQSAALYALAAPLGAEGIVKLLEEAKQELVGGDYRGGSAILIGRYAELDFSAALAYALASGGAVRESWLQAIFHARARLDLDDAVDKAVTLNPSARHVAGLSILRSVDNISATVRRSIAKRLGIPNQMLAVSQHNPVDAWHEARGISDPMQRAQTQMGVVMMWARSDPSAALHASEEISNSQMRQAIQSEVLALLAVDDIAAALNWIDAQPEGQHDDQLTMAFISGLATKDPELAQSLITRLPEEKRDQVELAIWSQRAGSNPEGAAAWVSSRSDQNQRIGAANQLLMMLSMTSQESADRFFEALPAGEAAKVESTYLQMLARTDPGRAAQRLDQIGDEGQRYAIGSSLVSSWASTDPEEARQWIDRQPSNATPALYHSLGVGWAQRDVSAAQEFAVRQNSGADRDQLLAGIVSSGQLDPDDAEQMRQRISDPALRESVQQIVEMRRKSLEGRQGIMGGANGAVYRSFLNGAQVQKNKSMNE